MAIIGTFKRGGDEFTCGQDADAQLQSADLGSIVAVLFGQLDFRIFAGATELGAAWKKTSNGGREYLSVKLDDPSFPAPVYASLIEGEGVDNFSLIWSRSRKLNGD